MKLPILTLFLIIASQCSAFAYHNFYYENPRSLAKKKEHRGIPPIEHSFDLEFARKFVAYFDFNKRENYSFKDLSDAAVYLTQLGKVEQALELLKWLHNNHPNEYKITANLGTTFELAGQIDSAEVYLNKAMASNPNAEHSSEWIHLKILAAKRQMAANPSWILENNVLDLKWDTSFYASYPDSLISLQKRDSIRQIRYKRYENQSDTIWHIGMQMRERIPFASKPDLLVANIMKELAAYLAMNLSVKDAFVAYKIAMYYDPKDQLNIQKQLDKLMPNFEKYEFDEKVFHQKFHPAAAFSEAYLDYLPQNRNGKIEAAEQTSSALFWQAKLAILVLIVLLLRLLFVQRKNN